VAECAAANPLLVFCIYADGNRVLRFANPSLLTRFFLRSVSIAIGLEMRTCARSHSQSDAHAPPNYCWGSRGLPG